MNIPTPILATLDATSPIAVVSLSAQLLISAMGVAGWFTVRNRTRRFRYWNGQILATTLTSLHEAVLITNGQGQVTTLNPTAEALTGWTATEALGRPIGEILKFRGIQIYPTNPNPISQWIAASDTRCPSDHPLLIARDGTERRITYSATPVRDSAAKVGGLVVVFHDVTEEYAINEALRESDARYRTLFDSIDEGFCVIEMIFNDQQLPIDYRFLEVNPTFEKQTGLKNATGKRMKELAPNHEAHWFEVYGRIAITGEPFRFQNRAEQLNRWYDVYAFRFGDPKNRQVAILFNDITARVLAEDALRRSEQNLAVTLDSIGDAVLATDTEGRVTRLNPVAERLMGWTQADALGRPVSDVFWIINEETRAPAAIPVSEVLSTGGIYGLANHTLLIARDGTERPIADSAAPIRDKDGTILGVVLVFRDVTAEHEAVRALHESEALNRTVLNSVMANIAVINREGRIIAINDGWEQFEKENGTNPSLPCTGVGANYIEECARAAIKLGEEANVILNGLHAVLNRTAAAFRYEYNHHSPPVQRWFSMQVSPLARADGGAVISLVNITDRKRAEQLLADFKAALDEHAIVVVTNAFGSITYVNDNYCSISKYSRDELIGRDHRIVHPRFFHDSNGSGASENGNDDSAWRDEIKSLAKDGSPYWLDTTIVPFRGADGNPIQYIAICTDVTERHRAEDEIRGFNLQLEKLVAERTEEIRQALATLDATDDGAFISDPETLRFIYINQGAVRQLGYTREELLGMTPWDIMPGTDESTIRQMLAPLTRGEIQSHHSTTLYRHKDGREFPVEINLQYITSVGAGRFIAIVRDITERLKNQRLAFRSQRLESIGTLAGGVAHDLNNALAPIMMSVELLRIQYPDNPLLLDMIKDSAKRAADMVRQLVSFAKGAEGERVAVQPRRLVKEMEKIITGSFPKNIKLVVNCAPTLQTIRGDPTQLHQILLNLCVNARDAMPDGGVLTIEAENQEVDTVFASSTPNATPGNYVALRVRDSGTGIPPEILDRIFDPFFSTKGPDKGTGLGLSTVLGIVKGHDGFLQVYSHPGQGTIFTTYLPAENAGSEVEPIAKPELDFRGRGETILFVDDEPSVREAARAVLRRLNFNPLTAIDGTDGLIQAAQHRTELHAVITDMHMPHMDGLAFVRTLRRMLPDIPITVASGRMEDALSGEFKALGVPSRLDKPFTEGQLVESLRNLLSSAKQHPSEV